MTGNSTVHHFKTDQFTDSTFRFLLFKHRTIDKVLTFSKLGNPPQTGFNRRCRIIQIIAIQAEAHFQTKRIACTQANRLDAKFFTCLKHGIPNLHGSFGIEVKLKTSCTGIAGIGNNHIFLTGKLTMRKGVIRQFRQVYTRQFLQSKNGFRSLYGKLSHVVGSIFQFSTFGIVRNAPVPVFFYIRSIHYQQVFLRFIMINQQVIYNTAFFVRKTGILHLARSQGSYIIGSHFLKKSQWDHDTKVKIIRAKAQKMGAQISEEIVQFLADYISANVREIEGALSSLVANASFLGRKITTSLAKEILKAYVQLYQKEITIEHIIEVVCGYLALDPERFNSPERTREIAQARQIAMYLAKQHTKAPLATIGAAIGGRNHATVLHSCKAVSNLLETDKAFRRQVEEIEKQVLA